MSEEETKVEAATEAPATEGSTTEEAAPKKKGKKWSIVVGVVVVVLIAAGAGFWVWHERYGVQPAQGAARRDRVQRVPQGAPRFCDVLHAVPQRGRSARGLADGCRGQQAFDCGVSH